MIGDANVETNTKKAKYAVEIISFNKGPHIWFFQFTFWKESTIEIWITQKTLRAWKTVDK